MNYKNCTDYTHAIQIELICSNRYILNANLFSQIAIMMHRIKNTALEIMFANIRV